VTRVELPFQGGKDGLNDPAPDPLPDLSNPQSLPGVLAVSRHVVKVGAPASAASTLHVSVVFNVPLGQGKVTLLVPTLDGRGRFETFEQNGTTQMAIAPLGRTGVWIYHIGKDVKGTIVVATVA
jgi:hypothetical protein